MSNSLLVDDNESSTPGDLDKLRKDLTEATTSQERPKEKAEPESEFPDKYRGKSVEDIIKMHQNAESELGRRGNELGQYKKLTDELLDLKRRSDLAKGGAEQEETEEIELPKISSTDLLDDPNQALEKLLQARDKSQERKRQRQEAESAKQELERTFAQNHPDAEAIVQSPEFVKWVSDSTARSLLGYQAAQGDLVAGDALLTEWKAAHHSEEEEVVKQEDHLQKARKASTESQGTSRTPDAPTGKKYRRLDLIRLKLEDPEAYADEAFQREIIRAYAEGRVI